MPMFGDNFLAITWTKNFYGISIDYYISIGKEKAIYHAYFYILMFWAVSRGKLGVVTTRPLWVYSLGLQDPTKNLGHWVDLLDQLLSKKTHFQNLHV